MILACDILKFWFEEIKPKQWWVKDDVFDQCIQDRFSAVHQQAIACELFHWRKTAEGRLAEIIVLDQFSRNMYRNCRRSFESDPMALILAQEAVASGVDKQLASAQNSFLYMPYMHSESRVIHEKAVELYTNHGDQGSLEFEIKHKVIIDRFGRYPHRNKILGRASTDEEIEFLQQSGASF